MDYKNWWKELSKLQQEDYIKFCFNQKDISLKKLKLKLVGIYPHHSWESKSHSCIFVNTIEEKEELYKLLCQQDNYWEFESYKDLIQLFPEIIKSESDIYQYCGYTGKTDIYNFEELQLKIPFIVVMEISMYDVY